MRGVVVDAPGGVERLGIAELPEPQAGPGEVLIQVAHAACNWGDVQKRQGIYPDPVAYPATLGGEVSGHIVACGRGVRAFRPGQPVAAITGVDMLRGFAEMVAVPSSLAIPLPPEADLRAAAAFPVASLTAFHLLHTAHHIRRSDRILVHAAGGGVGLAVTQLARNAGATVFGTVGSAEKATLPLSLGARRVVVRNDEDFVDAVLDETGGAGVDLVIDSLGADVLERSFDALKPFGRLINIGEAAGEPDFPIRKTLYRRSTSMAGFELMHATPGSRRWRRGVLHVMEAIAAGRLVLPIGAEFPLDDVRDAHRLMESRQSVGKVLLRIRAEG